MIIAMCGNRCDLCKAYAPNVEKEDRRAELSRAWKQYYDLNIPAEEMVCDGCRAEGPDVRRVDECCPVRPCGLARGLNHCGECGDYPCALFAARQGLSAEAARAAQGDAFDPAVYEAYLSAYDNRTRLDATRLAK